MENIETAKLFKNGNSQAVRLPMEYRFEGKEVLIYREGSRVVLQSIDSNWNEFFACKKSVSDDFMADRKDNAPQKRELF